MIFGHYIVNLHDGNIRIDWTNEEITITDQTSKEGCSQTAKLCSYYKTYYIYLQILEEIVEVNI